MVSKKNNDEIEELLGHQIKLPPEIIEEMNSYVDMVINDKKKIAKV